MAQDDPVVSAQWLHQHLGAPDVKVLDASWYMPVENRDPWEEYQVFRISCNVFVTCLSFKRNTVTCCISLFEIILVAKVL